MDFKRKHMPQAHTHTHTHLLAMNYKHTHRTNLSWKPWISVYFRYLQFDNDRHPGLFGMGIICNQKMLWYYLRELQFVWLLLFIRFVRFSSRARVCISLDLLFLGLFMCNLFIALYWRLAKITRFHRESLPFQHRNSHRLSWIFVKTKKSHRKHSNVYGLISRSKSDS